MRIPILGDSGKAPQLFGARRRRSGRHGCMRHETPRQLRRWSIVCSRRRALGSSHYCFEALLDFLSLNHWPIMWWGSYMKAIATIPNPTTTIRCLPPSRPNSCGIGITSNSSGVSIPVVGFGSGNEDSASAVDDFVLLEPVSMMGFFGGGGTTFVVV